MVFEFLKFLWQVFRKDKKARALRGLSLKDSFNDLLLTHQVSISGTDTYNAGRTFTDKEKAREFQDKVLKPRFDNLRKSFVQCVNDKREQLAGEIAKAANAIAKINEDLDESKPSSPLFPLNKELEEIEKRKKEIEKLMVPEDNLQEYSKDTFSRYKENFNKLAENAGDDNEVIRTALTQKENQLFTKRESNWFKKYIDSLRSTIHTSYYPPKRRVYTIFFGICTLLLLCEIGFSFVVVKKISDVPRDYRQYETGIFLLYSIGISVALAVFYKKLIDSFLYRSRTRITIFWVIFLLLTFIMIIFFSASFENRSRIVFSFTQMGLVLGFFSNSFAMANAFIFREAIYLFHLYRRIYPVRNEKATNHRKRKTIEKLKKNLEGKENEFSLLNYQAERIESDESYDILRQITSLEDINLTSFWQGFDRNISEMIADNQDIVLAMMKNIKKGLSV